MRLGRDEGVEVVVFFKMPWHTEQVCPEPPTLWNREAHTLKSTRQLTAVERLR